MAKMITGISVYQTDGGWSDIYPLVGAQGQEITIPVASDDTAGVLKVYSSTGNNTDGTMTQNAISSAIQTAINSIPSVAAAGPNTAGIARLYDSLGTNTDGAPTQRAVQAAIQAIPTVAQASATAAGVSRLYTGMGANTDGSMTQAAITQAIDDVDNSNFDTITVGNTNFTASEGATTLTFLPGSNVTLNASASGRSITISSSDTTYVNATESTSGLMSSSDKVNLRVLSTSVAQLPIGNSQVSIAVADWGSTTTAINGVAYYTCKKSLQTLNDEHPVVYLSASGSNTLPTVDEETAYNLIKYVTVDVSAKTITFYAEEVPATAIMVWVKNCTQAN